MKSFGGNPKADQRCVDRIDRHAFCGKNKEVRVKRELPDRQKCRSADNICPKNRYTLAACTLYYPIKYTKLFF